MTIVFQNTFLITFVTILSVPVSKSLESWECSNKANSSFLVKHNQQSQCQEADINSMTP